MAFSSVNINPFAVQWLGAEFSPMAVSMHGGEKHLTIGQGRCTKVKSTKAPSFVLLQFVHDYIAFSITDLFIQRPEMSSLQRIHTKEVTRWNPQLLHCLLYSSVHQYVAVVIVQVIVAVELITNDGIYNLKASPQKNQTYPYTVDPLAGWIHDLADNGK